MKTYKAALIGCSRMGAFIDNEVMGSPWAQLPYSHAAGYEASDRTDFVACSDLRTEVMEQVGNRYGVAKEKQYTDYKALIDKEQPDIVSVATQPEHRAEIVIYAAEHGVGANLRREGDGGVYGRGRRDGRGVREERRLL